MRRRHRGHFDFWADFHTDNAAVFAFLEKSLRRLVNALIKAGTTGAAASFFAWAAAGAGDVEFMTSAMQPVSPARSSRDTGAGSACSGAIFTVINWTTE